MTPSAWIALASLAAVLFVQTSVVAFALGRLFQRVTQVERDVEHRATTNDTVIELKVKMDHMEAAMTKQATTLEGMSRQLANIAMNRIGLSGELK